MCGICGIVGREPVDAGLLQAMTDAVYHRGPDEDGYFVDDGVGFGMRRLSILDLAHGKQPFFNEDRSVVVIFNGEIYNYPELRDDLLRRGHVLHTRSDTETLPHLYESYGDDFPSRLRGMFAIALYDRAKRRLLLVRDRLGKKPLYYARRPDRVLFGSEIHQLVLADPSLNRLDERAIYPFFRHGFVPEPATAYPEIRSVPAGAFVAVEDGEVSVHQYWDLRFEPGPPKGDEAIVDELDRTLNDAVCVRLLSDVPVGAFLSGGPDSSLIVAYLSKLVGKPVKTFTVGFDEPDYDEREDAKRVADFVGAESFVRVLSLDQMRRDLFPTLSAIVRHTGQPFGDSSALPTYFVSQLAREEVKVILAGDGADEVFAGYTMYQGLRFAQQYQRLPGAVRRSVLEGGARGIAGVFPAGSVRRRLGRWQKRLADSSLPLPELYLSKVSPGAISLLDDLIPGAAELPPAIRTGTEWADFGDSDDPFSQMIYVDTRFHLVNTMLVKVDRMSMAHSLEVRNPYLDHQLVELAATIPPSLKLRGWKTKAILRDVAARHLPERNARKKKQGFSVPLGEWFRTTLYAELRDRLEASQAVSRYLRPPAVSRLVGEHHEGRADHSAMLWLLLVFDEWHRQSFET